MMSVTTLPHGARAIRRCSIATAALVITCLLCVVALVRLQFAPSLSRNGDRIVSKPVRYNPDAHALLTPLRRLPTLTSTRLPTTRVASVQPRSRIAIATISVTLSGAPTNSSLFAQLMRPYSIINKIDYCRRHRYDLFIGGRSCLPHGESDHAAFGKIRLLRMLLLEYEWVLVMDQDAVFANASLRIEDAILRLLPHADGSSNNARSQDLIVTQDWNGINTGVMLVRRSEWSRNFFERVAHPPRECRHSGPWWEQSVITCLLDQRKVGFGAMSDGWKIAFARQRLMNSYPAPYDMNVESARYVPGDFIVHFAGAAAFASYKFPVSVANATLRAICRNAFSGGVARWDAVWAARDKLPAEGRWLAADVVDDHGAVTRGAVCRT